MEWIQIEAKWKGLAGSAYAHWSKLSNEDWQAIDGKKEQLVGRIQERYGITREAAERQVDAWSNAVLDIAEPKKPH